MLIAHGPLGDITNRIIQKNPLKKLSQTEKVIILITALISGILPDFDFFIVIARHQPVFIHHDLVTHTPFFWILIYLILRLILKYGYQHTSKKFQGSFKEGSIKIFLNTILIGTMSHLFADLLTGSLMLFYPLSTRGYSVLAFPMPVNMFGGYFAHPLFYLELSLGVIFTTLLLASIFKLNRKATKKVLSVTYIATVIVLSLTMGIYFSNYNPSYIPTDRGLYRFDQDYDKITDTDDWDTDNDGESNILDVTREEILEGATRVSQEEMHSVKYVEENRSLFEKAMFRYGSVDSYRLVQMTYLLNNTPIPPVLSYEINKGDSQAYWHDIEEDEELLKYFQDRDLLDRVRLSNSLNKYQGSILFMLNEEDEIINVGIILEDNNILITFGNGEIAHHSEEVIEQLGGELKSVMVVR